jgi:carotenoid cleavage dioxygenase
MAPPTAPLFPGETAVTELSVQGAVPDGMNGQLLGIGPGADAEEGVAHSIDLHAGRLIDYRSRFVVTDLVARRLAIEPSPGPRNTGPDTVTGNIIHFGGSILALGEGTLAYELTSDLGTLRRVDLAGSSRGLSAYPRRDPVTGDLHLLTIADAGDQKHVVVSAGAFTRTSRSITGAPGPIKDLGITRDRVVFVADGFIGVATRPGDADITWVCTDVDAPYLVHAHDAGGSTVVYAVRPSLERWTVEAASLTVRREVLDPTRQHFAHTNDRPVGEPPRYLWTTGDTTADKHDLITSTCVRRAFPPDCQPADFVFVADAARRSDADGGWLVGFVHHSSGDATDLVVLDAADIARPAIATACIPRRVPPGVRCTWLSSVRQ